MNKREWTEWINRKTNKGTINTPFGKLNTNVIDVKTLENLISRLPEDELTIIPQFVAGHIKNCKAIGKRLNVALSESPETMMCNIMGLTIEEANEVYARAWLDGYEIESDPVEDIFQQLDKLIKTGGFDKVLKEKIAEILEENDGQ